MTEQLGGGGVEGGPSSGQSFLCLLSPACWSLAAFFFTSSCERPSVMATTTLGTFLRIPFSTEKAFS